MSLGPASAAAFPRFHPDVGIVAVRCDRFEIQSSVAVWVRDEKNNIHFFCEKEEVFLTAQATRFPTRAVQRECMLTKKCYAATNLLAVPFIAVISPLTLELTRHFAAGLEYGWQIPPLDRAI